VCASSHKDMHVIRIWEARSGALAVVLEGSPVGLHTASWLPDPSRCACCLYLRCVRLTEHVLQCMICDCGAATATPQTSVVQACRLLQLIASITGTGSVYIWAYIISQSWDVYAPGFRNLAQNEEYVENETAFDINDVAAAGEHTGPAEPATVRSAGAQDAVMSAALTHGKACGWIRSADCKITRVFDNMCTVISAKSVAQMHAVTCTARSRMCSAAYRWTLRHMRTTSLRCLKATPKRIYEMESLWLLPNSSLSPSQPHLHLCQRPRP
jgi:hypothetical protein